MPQTDTPLRRSIGLSGFFRWVVAVVAVIAIGGAFAAGQKPLATAGLVFLAAAVTLSYRAWRARQADGAAGKPERPL
jgi:membrane protein implicated in regulation of membrane protease activity